MNPGIDGADQNMAYEARETIKYSETVFQCVAVETAVFSRPPFGEEWSIDGVRVEGLLRIPEITCRLLKLLHENSSMIRVDGGQNEQWEVDKDALIGIVNTYLTSPEKDKLVESGWISENEVKGIEQCIETLSRSENTKVTINPEYPTTDLLEAFQKEFERPNSLVMLGGNNSATDQFTFKTTDVNSEVLYDHPSAVLRIRTIDPTSGESVSQCFSDELAHYIPDEATRMALIKQLNPSEDEITPYLGDIGKLNTVSDTVLQIVAKAFIKKMIGTDPNNIPQQLVYFTLKDTPVANSGLKAIVDFGLRLLKKPWAYDEDRITTDYIKNGDKTELVIGILRLNINPNKE